MIQDSEKHVAILKIGQEKVAIDIFEVEEILKYEKITFLPKYKDYIEGIMNFKEDTINLIDIAKKLKLPSNPENKDTRTIILNVHDMNIGIRVDAFDKILTIFNNYTQKPTKKIYLKIQEEYIKEIIANDDEIITILNLPKIFEEEILLNLSRKKEIITEKKSKEINEDQNPKKSSPKKPNSKSRNQDTKKKIIKTKTLKQSENGSHFITPNNQELKDAKELYYYITNLNDDEFKVFVTEDKNDFYNWLKLAVKEDELAEKIKLLKTKEDITAVIKEYIKELL